MPPRAPRGSPGTQDPSLSEPTRAAAPPPNHIFDVDHCPLNEGLTTHPSATAGVSVDSPLARIGRSDWNAWFNQDWLITYTRGGVTGTYSSRSFSTLNAHVPDATTTVPATLASDWVEFDADFDLKLRRYADVHWLYCKLAYDPAESVCAPRMDPRNVDPDHQAYAVSGLTPYAVWAVGEVRYHKAEDYTSYHIRIYVGSINHCSYFLAFGSPPFTMASDLNYHGEWNVATSIANKGALAETWLSFFEIVTATTAVWPEGDPRPTVTTQSYPCDASRLLSPWGATYENPDDTPTGLAFSHGNTANSQMNSYISSHLYSDGCICVKGDQPYLSDETLAYAWNKFIGEARITQKLVWQGPSGRNVLEREYPLSASMLVSAEDFVAAHERVRQSDAERWLLRNVDYNRLMDAVLDYRFGNAAASCKRYDE